MRLFNYSVPLTLLAAAIFGGCTPDKGPGGLETKPNAQFSVTPLSGKINQYVAAATDAKAIFYWDKGDGTRVLGSQNDTIYYKHAGNYRVTLLTMNNGGYDTSSQVVQVATTDPGVNILADNSGVPASANWTVLNTGGSQTSFTFSGNGLNLSNTGNTNGAIYQAVAVKAGVPYSFSALINGQGASNSWIEFYIGTTVPVQGSDYSDNKLWSMNTWSGCGGSAFDGDVVTIGCAGSGNSYGDFVPAKDETVYVVIKAGSSGGTLGTGGVNVTSVTLNKPSN